MVCYVTNGIADDKGDEKSIKSKNSNKTKIKPINDQVNHRDRAKNRFLEIGGDKLEDYELLEMLLFYIIPRKDTKSLAKQLIRDFGSFDKVFEAECNDLEKYSGISRNGSIFLKLILESNRRYNIKKVKHLESEVFDSIEKIGKYFHKMLNNSPTEVAFIMFLDNSNKMITCEKISDGELNTATINMREIIELTLKYKATAVVLAHNHPDGTSRPSSSDVTVTQLLKTGLKIIDVVVLEHIIVTPTKYISMTKGGYVV